jgi:hypothetical protein
MFKSVCIASMIAAASAQGLFGTGAGATDFSSLFLLDAISGGDYYGHGSGIFGGGSDLLTLAAFGGLGGDGATGTSGISDLLLLDQFSGHGRRGGRHGSSRGGSSDLLTLAAFGGLGGTGAGIFGGDAAGTNGISNLLLLDQFSGHGSGSTDFLPIAALTGGLGAQSDISNLFFLNQFGGGSHGEFEDLALLSAFGGVEGANLNQLWGQQQLINGHSGIVPLLQATGQALPTDFTQLALLNQLDSQSGRGYSRHYPRRSHGYSRHHAPRRAGAYAPRVVAPRVGY